jgi:nitrite reductase/ring-hydroxylating ferredoxin subunit
MQRRDFLRSSCLGCAGLALGAVSLAGCSTLPIVKVEGDGTTLDIPLTAFAESTMVVARSPKLSYDVLVLRRTDATYHSLYLRCTHEDQPITATASGLHCPSHGSRFALDGSVEEGPATQALRTFPVDVLQDHLSIRLHPKP